MVHTLLLQNPENYDLYGVVEHLGNSSKGHYVCYIRSSETDWYLFNDDKVIYLLVVTYFFHFPFSYMVLSFPGAGYEIE